MANAQQLRRVAEAGASFHTSTLFPHISKETLAAAKRSAGAVAHAVDQVLLGKNRNAFCLVRPPGHNVGYEGILNGMGGFGVFNNVAAAALHALEEHADRCQRVAIIDFDIHHGRSRAVSTCIAIMT
jgi:acetoin utilization deacetylase AcuC-like enzyme